MGADEQCQSAKSQGRAGKNRGRRVGIIPNSELAASTLAAAVEREQSAPDVADQAVASFLEIAGAPVEDPRQR